MPSKKNKTGSKTKKMSRRSAQPKTTKKPTKKKSTKKSVPKPKARNRKKRQSVDLEAELRREVRGQAQRSSGHKTGQRAEDFEGLSAVQQADSESIDELVEEGNIFEAGAVAGVEEADNSDEREVRTREFPADDVPEEYLDKD